ncbi:DUF222 domain-containing protein, partial [Mycobacterium bohemicum]|nr:DUF222 domain-containing protein [Mycobacterium bohemicum]
MDALAATVCAHDPRAHAQRRADALGALAAGADRLGCGCGHRRLDALAATVCAHDPRAHAQRRADALGALAAGADRLGCGCG